MARTSEDDSSVPQDLPLEKQITAILKVISYAGGAFFIAIMLMTVVHVIGRYGFNKPIPGFVELSSFFFILAIFLLFAYIMVIKRHVTIGLIVDHFPERTQAIMDVVLYLACLFFAVVACWRSVVRGILITGAGETSTILLIPEGPFYILIGFGWGLFGLAIIMHLVHLIMKVLKR